MRGAKGAVTKRPRWIVSPRFIRIFCGGELIASSEIFRNDEGHAATTRYSRKKGVSRFGVEGVRAPLRLCSNVHAFQTFTVLDTTYRRSTHRAHTHEETRARTDERGPARPIQIRSCRSNQALAAAADWARICFMNCRIAAT